MKYNLELEINDFKDFLQAKLDLDFFHAELAMDFLERMWIGMKEKFPQIECFGITLEYEYNDKTYDLDTSHITINDYTLEWFNDDETEENLKGIGWLEKTNWVGNIVEFWKAHKPLFDKFYGDAYSFYIKNGKVLSIQKFDNPNCEDRW